MGLFYRLFEREMFESVQGVVVNEDSNGALPGKQMGALFDCAAQSAQAR